MFGIGEKISNIIAGGLGIALAAALIWGGIEHLSASHYHKLTDQNAATAQLANSKLEISNASIDTLTNALSQMNAQSDARAKAYADSKAQDAQTIAELDRQYAGTDAQRKALEAIAKVPGGSDACRAPAALTRNLEGL